LSKTKNGEETMENNNTQDNGVALADDQKGLFANAAEVGNDQAEASKVSQDAKDQAESKEEPQSPTQKSELEQLQLELEKSQKIAKEHKRLAHQAGSKFGRLKKELGERLTSAGDFSQDEVEGLFKAIEETVGTSSVDEEDDDSQMANTFYGDILKKVAKELPTVKKYTKDEKLQNKLNAFIFFADHGSDQEKEDLAYELNELRDDPAELTRRVLEIGEFHRDDYFGEIEDAGGLPSYIKKNREEKKKLQKTIDKLKDSMSIYDQSNSQKILNSGPNKETAKSLSEMFSRQ
jgi:hypothetical protein